MVVKLFDRPVQIHSGVSYYIPHANWRCSFGPQLTFLNVKGIFQTWRTWVENLGGTVQGTPILIILWAIFRWPWEGCPNAMHSLLLTSFRTQGVTNLNAWLSKTAWSCYDFFPFNCKLLKYYAWKLCIPLVRRLKLCTVSVLLTVGKCRGL